MNTCLSPLDKKIKHQHPTVKMLVAQSAISGDQMVQQQPSPKSSRKPLQPRNPSATPFSSTVSAKPKPKPAEWIEISLSQARNANKENVPPVSYNTPPVRKESFRIDSLDASLAEQLGAIREKLERLRIDKDKTEKMLRERALRLDLQMKEILERGELQKQLEIEVDRLYGLKEIKLSCSSTSPIRSLRDKEEEKKVKQHQLKASNHKTEDRDEEKEELSPLQSPNSGVITGGVKLSQTLS